MYTRGPANQPPIADAGLDQPAVECGGPKAGGAAVTLDGSDGGTHTDTVTETVVDKTPPALIATLVPIDVKKDQGTFEVQFTCADDCDSAPAITTATLNGVDVTNGQIVRLRVKKAKSSKSAKGEGDAILTIEGPAFELTINCVAGAGNVASATATPAFAQKGAKSQTSEKSAKSGKSAKSQKSQKSAKSGKGAKSQKSAKINKNSKK